MVMLFTARNKIASSPLFKFLRHLAIRENIVLHEVEVQVIRKFLISVLHKSGSFGYQAQSSNHF